MVSSDEEDDAASKDDDRAELAKQLFDSGDEYDDDLPKQVCFLYRVALYKFDFCQILFFDTFFL